MPVRGEAKEEPKRKAPVGKVADKPAPRKAPGKREEEVEKPVAGKPEVIKKSILEERVKKFIKSVDETLLDNVNDVFERAITDTSTGEKANVLFIAFSPNGTDDDVVDDAFNVDCIKTLLFAYMTVPEKGTSGKLLFAEVMPPTEADAPHISVDTFLGLPFNIASYGLLAKILEEITGYPALGIEGTLKCVHFYDNQYDAVEELLSRDVEKHQNCGLAIADKFHFSANIDEVFANLEIKDFVLTDYTSDEPLPVEMLAPKEL